MEYIPVTRREVERELERKSASIAGSISRIKEDLSLPTEPVKAAVREHPVEVLVGTIAFGLVCGWFVTGKRKDKKHASRARPGKVDVDATEFLRMVRMGREAGLSENEAVSSAMRATSVLSGGYLDPPRPTLSRRLGDHVIDMAESVIQAAVRVVAREAAGWLAEAVRREKPPESH
jgi:hypothetical protein